jgi:hypothetical protein
LVIVPRQLDDVTGSLIDFVMYAQKARRPSGPRYRRATSLDSARGQEKTAPDKEIGKDPISLIDSLLMIMIGLEYLPF